ncbi:MAG: 1-acyl-sn-glycerol-3-phosphate acyltransferase [candidate division Zixibacteria bacterium]|nr:1-acyl-sn-glycerol-3-phosphate acyltransferase [candidate division Zixibacteria bacterium]
MKWFYYVAWRFVRTVGYTLFGLKAVDEKNIPRTGPVLIASNHQSYFDPPFVAVMIMREVHFFAKKELFDIPIMKRVITALNAVPVRRGIYDPRSINKVFDVLSKGGGLILFPEGTRGDGETLLKPKPGIGLIAYKGKAPIVPAFAHRTHQWSKSLFWRNRMSVTFGKPITVEEILAYEDGKEGYRALSEEVMRRIKELKDKVLEKN